jgi:hypothetical protein
MPEESDYGNETDIVNKNALCEIKRGELPNRSRCSVPGETSESAKDHNREASNSLQVIVLETVCNKARVKGKTRTHGFLSVCVRRVALGYTYK